MKLVREGRVGAYAALNGAYWMMYCVVQAYAGVFLQDRGYSNTGIGTILAAGLVAGLIIQPALAILADRGGKAPLAVMGGALVAVIGFALALWALPGQSAAVTAVFVLFQAVAIAMQPLVNAFAFYLERLGTAVPFGLCRAIGSLSYAVLSAILGVLTVRTGTQSVPAAAVVVALGMGCLLVWFARGEPPERIAERNDTGAGSSGLLKNRRFLFLLIATALIFAGHAFLMNFTIQIVQGVGGDSGDMGALAAYAAVLEIPGMVLFDRLNRRFPCGSVLRFAAAFFAVKGLAVLAAGSMTGLYGGLFFQGLSYALFIPASVRYAGEVSGPENANKAQAYVTAMITVGNIAASAAGGVIIDGLGLKSATAVAAYCAFIGYLVMQVGLSGKKTKENNRAV